MPSFGGLFDAHELYMLTGAANQLHVGFVESRKSAFFFTSLEKAQSYARDKRLVAKVSRVNWRVFEQTKQGLLAAHIRRGAIDPIAGDEDAARIVPIEQISSENSGLWADH